ncbi:transcriptional regulator, MarR family [Arcobacter nitrofigilis DSM 7299]|uniref:Transcriptional regulator, MarR family n=1 Tax=Arcobacter nitrofigilis (strain ATCC 33309 / DSM 7299 / CCUG 15893 / LMG 7604 / NCTC 12251 / CI) TaxID=572480 RepID=D5V2S3_ARCNC|nr:MarR family transcriptional regulator [Arcobacter nitrofigilis]ADG92505.1 transcriptional regulator, MarR family [Arcobacter nitrofigilis DSM 7299]
MNFDMNNSLGFILNRTALAMKTGFNKQIKEFDISPEQWSLIFRIVENNGLTQKELASSTYKDQANITRSLDRLEKKGFLTRLSNSKDRRIINIFSTQKAKELVEIIVPISKQYNQLLSTGLSQEEYESLIGLLNKVYTNIEEEGD